MPIIQWSPVNFAVSLLADTPGRFAMLDCWRCST